MICTNNDFFNQLENDSSDEEECLEENLCLISGMELKENYVELHCGHKFNYFELTNLVNSVSSSGGHFASGLGSVSKLMKCDRIVVAQWRALTIRIGCKLSFAVTFCNQQATMI